MFGSTRRAIPWVWAPRACVAIYVGSAMNPLGAVAQVADVLDVAPNLAYVLKDEDGDLVPDRVGQRFRVSGYTNMRSRSARSDAGGELFYVTIEDGTAGLRLLVRDEALIAPLDIGAWVEAEGLLTHRRGSEELFVDRLEVLPRSEIVTPVDVLARDVLGEAWMHRLVRVEGTLTAFDRGRESVTLRDRSGSVQVRIPNRFLDERELFAWLPGGGEGSVVGVVSQADRVAPFDDGYRLAPRDASDLVPLPVLPILQIVLGSLFALLALGWVSSVQLRRRAVRRAHALEALMAELAVVRRRDAAHAEEFQALFEDDSVARFVQDGSGRIRRSNRALAGFLGRTMGEIDGHPLSDFGLEGPLTGPVFEDGASQGRVYLRTPDGEVRVGLLTLTTLDGDEGEGERQLGAIVDVTRRSELEEQLAHSQKMDALGRLAGGVAHDINNMLTTILGNTELVLDDTGLEAGARKNLEEVQGAAARSARMTRQLLTMARRDIARPEPLDFADLVTDLAPMLQRMGTNVELVTLLGTEAMWIRADLSRTEQVVLNLVSNAREAIVGSGKISVELSRDGDEVVLRVSDDGVGMDSATRARIFEPFFTTKEHGTGLGLSTAYGIVTDAGGSLTCSSELGRGTTFELRLPACAPSIRAEDGSSPTRPRAQICRSVLLAEDEPSIRAMVGRLLKGMGCSVVDAANGEEALRAFSAAPHTFDVLLTDIVMPIMSGNELAQAVTSIRPEIPVVFMSGYVDEADAPFELQGPQYFLPKPFKRATLKRCWRRPRMCNGSRYGRMAATTGGSVRKARTLIWPPHTHAPCRHEPGGPTECFSISASLLSGSERWGSSSRPWSSCASPSRVTMD